MASMTTLFHRLARLVAYERQSLPFVRSTEDRNIVIAIGLAAESGTPVGFKQLVLLHLASPSTVTRKVKHLLRGRVIRRVTPEHDGRMVRYVLTKKTLECFDQYLDMIQSLMLGTEPLSLRQTPSSSAPRSPTRRKS
jgi:DNA-binding MarR family transcriptional regulator